jgi:hypothetical protein
VNYELSTAYTVPAKIIESLLECREPGLVVSVDVGGSLFDVIAENAAKVANCKFVSSHSLLRHKAMLGDVGGQLRVATVLAEPVMFGRVDGWLRDGDAGDPFDSYSPRCDKVATQAIDSWSADRPPIRLLHLGDPDLAIDQLLGARQTIRRDRPILTFYTTRLEKPKVLGVLEALDYSVFNLSGKLAKTADPNPVTDFGWIVVPAELQDDVSAAVAQAVNARDHGPSAWDIEMDRCALPRQRRSAGIFGLLSGASRPLPLERMISSEEILCLNDSYPLESAGDHSWRWLGPRPRTRLAVPCPLPCPFVIKLNVTGCKLKGGLAECRVIVEGREVLAEASDSSAGLLTFAASVEPENYAGYIEVDVVSAGALLPAPGDPRTLRLCLESIAVSPWH